MTLNWDGDDENGYVGNVDGEQLSRENEILAAYSTPGLKRNLLSRAAKKEHLRSLKRSLGLSEADIEKTLGELYPTEEK
jgi:hypothetical protein